MPCKQKSYSRQKEKEYQISEHPHAFTGNVIPSNNHPEDIPSFCNHYKLCIELEVENRGSTYGVGVMSTGMLCLLMREGEEGGGIRERERECETKEERKENKNSG